jgi:diguanylate cyclase (GGDEF)-like protein/PAS domain S-box-containing protein
VSQEPCFADCLHEIVACFDKDLRHTYANHRVHQSTGLRTQNFIGKTNLELGIAPELAHYWDEKIRAVFDTGRVSDLQFEFTGPRGTICFSTRLKPEWDDAGKVVSVVAIARGFYEDINFLTPTLDAEAESSHYRAIVESSDDAIISKTLDGIVTSWNRGASNIFGYTSREMVGHPLLKLFPPDRVTEEDLILERIREGEKVDHFETIRLHKDGRRIDVSVTISPIYDRVGNIVGASKIARDITPVRMQQAQLAHVAYFDSLTDLPNRLLLSDRLHQAMAYATRQQQTLAVLYLDLDGFKYINDTFGHSVGDELLIAVSMRMKSALREVDTLARIGGDEFVAVLVNVQGLGECAELVERILNACSEPVVLDNRLMQVSASIGLTLYPQDDSSADQLLRHADRAMYEAKQSGKNRYIVFDAAHDTEMRNQSEELKRLQEAIDRSEFVLHYQPKVHLETGEVIGAEALIRWQHPERGLLAPATFLPLAERHVLSEQIGAWVLITALQQMSDWLQQGLRMCLSINVAARQIQHPGFAAELAAALANYPQIEAADLELEILETNALEDIGAVSAVMHECHRLGVRFAIDDFGTGYSSLTYLKRLPAETLKIDQSFVRDMLTDREDMAIVQNVIGLAESFHRMVIAEGVETMAHGAQLLRMGCKYGQGYGIARPMPAADLPAWILQWKAGFS